MDKNLSVWEWLLQCPYIADLYFNIPDTESGNTSFNPDTAHNDNTVKRYLDGSEEREYIFTIIRYEKYTKEPNSTTNITILGAIENIAEWIEAQEENRSYPVFPNNCTINEISVLPFANGGLAGIDEETAKYMFSIKIKYTFEKEN